MAYFSVACRYLLIKQLLDQPLTVVGKQLDCVPNHVLSFESPNGFSSGR